MTIYSKTNPFLASVKERYSLCQPGSWKNTQHLILDLKNSGITYSVGDSIGIYPTHHPELVQLTLDALNASGRELVREKQGELIFTLREFLAKKANITDFSRKFLLEISQRQTHPQKKEHLLYLLQEENREAFKTYQSKREVWQVLKENFEVRFDVQEFCHLLMPLLPRLYSISSSQKMVGEEVHLTIAVVEEKDETGYVRRGVCTHYLSSLAKLHEASVPVYIQPNHGFTIPEHPHTPMIMIGPGTGVAPFRAFMQERMMHHEAKDHWLFFGECHRSHHFFYESFWRELETQNRLRLNTAFSRDQEHKIYVQHQMLEQSEELFSWIQKGAIVYVCGDAHRMAKDVDAALQQIIQKQGNKDEQGSRAYLKQMRLEKRYLRDVY